MNIDTVAIMALGIFEVILFFLIFIRDQEITRKFRLYEKAIEDLSRENHKLYQEIKNIPSSESFEAKNINVQVQKEVREEVRKSLMPMVDSIKEIENVMSNFQNEQIDRIDALENSKKKVNFTPRDMVESNEKLIIANYKNGKSEAMIAKDLRISIGEVDLILKLANLK